MELKIDPDWLLKMAELEDGCCISVGGFYVRALKEEGYSSEEISKILGTNKPVEKTVEES